MRERERERERELDHREVLRTRLNGHSKGDDRAARISGKPTPDLNVFIYSARLVLN